MTRPRLPLPIRAIAQRKPLWIGALSGLALYPALTALQLDATARPLLAWDGAVAVDLFALAFMLHDATPHELARRAARADEGHGFILGVALLAVAASIVAIVIEAGAVAHANGADKLLHTLLALTTLALSWAFVHATFANHYAHEFYGPTEGTANARGGLLFPGDDQPDFWDFVHFAFVIGVANQTADVQITRKPMRNIVTLHGIVAFIFNTIVLALAINFAASTI